MNATSTPKLLEQYRRNKIRVDELGESLYFAERQMVIQPPILYMDCKVEAARVRKAWKRVIAKENKLRSELLKRFSQVRGFYAPPEDFFQFLEQE